MKRVTVWIAVLLLAAILTGCGGKETVMKEFKSVDESVAINMDETWVSESMGMDSWLAAFTGDGSEGIVVMQFEKGVLDANISDIAGLKNLIEDSYALTKVTSAKEPVIEGVNNVEAYTCTISIEGEKGDGYLVYGETDHAYYAIMYVGPDLNGKTKYFMKVCESFKENF